MNKQYKRFLPYVIFLTTILVGTVTLLISTQLKKAPEEQDFSTESNASTAVVYNENGDVLCEGELNGHKYELNLDVEVNEDPDSPKILKEGDATYDFAKYKTSYTIKIDSYKEDGQDVPRVDCVDSDGNVLTDIGGAGNKCEKLEEEGKEVPDGAHTRYNGVKLLWTDYRNFCDGSDDKDGDEYYTGQKCDTSEYSFCCWNENTPEHEIKHDRVWLKVDDSEGIKDSYTTKFEYNETVNNHCGSIQHDTFVPAFQPHDQKGDIQCKSSNGKGSMVIFTAVSQTGYSCLVPDNKPPVCDSIKSTPEPNTPNDDGSYPKNTEWTFVCRGSDPDKDGKIAGYEFQTLNADTNDVVDTIRCVDDNPTPSSPNAQSCLYEDNTGSLIGYKFPEQGKFRARCRVKDDKGEWSPY